MIIITPDVSSAVKLLNENHVLGSLQCLLFHSKRPLHNGNKQFGSTTYYGEKIRSGTLLYMIYPWWTLPNYVCVQMALVFTMYAHSCYNGSHLLCLILILKPFESAENIPCFLNQMSLILWVQKLKECHIEETYFYEGCITDVSRDGTVDYRGRPADKATSGRWKAVSFIMGMDPLLEL